MARRSGSINPSSLKSGAVIVVSIDKVILQVGKAYAGQMRPVGLKQYQSRQTKIIRMIRKNSKAAAQIGSRRDTALYGELELKPEI